MSISYVDDFVPPTIADFDINDIDMSCVLPRSWKDSKKELPNEGEYVRTCFKGALGKTCFFVLKFENGFFNGSEFPISIKYWSRLGDDRFEQKLVYEPFDGFSER